MAADAAPEDRRLPPWQFERNDIRPYLTWPILKILSLEKSGIHRLGENFVLVHHRDVSCDLIGACIARVNRLPTWTKVRRRHAEHLKRLLRAFGYVPMNVHYMRYGLTRIGQSCLVDVPQDRQGRLATFRGERIRLVCISSGPRSTRLLMAGRVHRTLVGAPSSSEAPARAYG